MTAKIILARRRLDRIVVDTHLDITKLLADGVTPDPRWVLHREWLLNMADWQARNATDKAAWIAAAKAEIVAAVAAQVAVLTDQDSGGTALSIEGTTF